MPYKIVYSEQLGNDDKNSYAFVKPPRNQSILRIPYCEQETSSRLFGKFTNLIKEIFLPKGYPDSVSKDYWNYQLWDTIQAFCSTISGTLSTHAILQGVGVGRETATAASAAITWILKDGTGMVSRILFAWMASHGLDADCKKWRMVADITNDLAMSLELALLPYFPDHSLLILCCSSSLKAIVGVAGGATRAAITQHQAIRGNNGDVAAKDGSQETIVNLVASFLSVPVISYVADKSHLAWSLFASLTLIHLFANFKAVRSLNFSFVNCERMNLLITSYIKNEVCSTVSEINKKEAVLPALGLRDKKLCGHKIKMGVSLNEISKSTQIGFTELAIIANLYKTKNFMIIYIGKLKEIIVCFKKSATSLDVIEGYFHATLMGIVVSLIEGNLKDLNFKTDSSLLSGIADYIKSHGDSSSPPGIELILVTDPIATSEFKQFSESLENCGKTVLAFGERGTIHGSLSTEHEMSKGWNTDFHQLNVGPWIGDWTQLKTLSESEISRCSDKLRKTD